MELNLDSLIHAPCALLMVDEDLKPLAGSRKGFSVFGVRVYPGRREEGVRELSEALGAEQAFLELVQPALERVRRPGSEAQFRWERGGRSYEVAVGMLDENRAYVLLFNDVTQQIRFDETQELARRYLEDILNNIQLGVVVLNKEMRVTNMNRAQEGFLHRVGTWLNWVEAIGMPISELSPQDQDLAWDKITKRVLEEGKSYEDPHRVYTTPEGDLVLAVEITPLKDQHGRMIGAIQVSEDVTEKVRLQEELRQAEIVAQRLEAVRETAITVNHEVNNPLTTILATAQMLLLSEASMDEKVRARLRQIEQDAKRIAEVTKRLRSVEEVKTKDYISEGPKMLDLGLGE